MVLRRVTLKTERQINLLWSKVICCYFLLPVIFLLMFVFLGFQVEAQENVRFSRVSLHKEIQLTEAERALIRQLPTLKIAAYPDAAPYVCYHPERKGYQGVGVDVFRFLAEQIGLKYEFVPPGETLSVDLERMKQGQIDVYLPLSENEERAQYAYFTQNYLYDYYAVIAPKKDNRHIISALSLQNKTVGYIAEGSIHTYLREGLNIKKLVPFYDKSLFKALRNSEIDVAIYVKRAFEQEQLKSNLFDLESIYVLQSFPRPYGFMLQKTDEHKALVAILNKYIPFLNISDSLAYHGVVHTTEMSANQQVRLLIYILIGLLVASGLLWAAMVRMSGSKVQIEQQLERDLANLLADKESLEKQNKSLFHLSLVDALTGLANRRAFDEVYVREFKRAQREDTPLSLLLLDLDHFKHVNDHFGHQEGDRYLKQVAQEIQRHLVRPTDLACRYGGEEFACILPDTTFADALFIAEKIRLGIMDLKLENPGSVLGLTLSIGVASTEGNGKDSEQLLKFADSYLYQAKRFGRNQVFGRYAESGEPAEEYESFQERKKT